jgi:glucose/arabinose dehydrogenase
MRNSHTNSLQLIVCGLTMIAVAGCTSTAQTPKDRSAQNSVVVDQRAESSIGSTDSASEATTASGPKPTVLVSDLRGPTQIAFGPVGTWLVAELGGEEPEGDENGSLGRVLLIDPTTKQRRVLADKLDKPTGVAWIDGTVWVMVRRGIVRFPLAEAPLSALMEAKDVALPTVVLSELPFNGRSEGTITPLLNGTFLYETTGNIKRNATGAELPEKGSGILWRFDTKTEQSIEVALGLKNSYAHSVLPDGRIVTTEIGDNIASEPLDELNVFDPNSPSRGSLPGSFGWPFCDHTAAPVDAKYEEACTATSPAMRTFPAHLTPTGVVHYGDDLYVSLFVSGQIMRLPNDAVAPPGLKPENRAPMQVWAADLEGPHTLLVDGQRLLVTETTAGRIVSFDVMN